MNTMLSVLMLCSAIPSTTYTFREHSVQRVEVKRQPVRKILIFSHKNCGACPKYQMNGYTSPELVELTKARWKVGHNGDVHVQIIRTDLDHTVATKYNVDMTPTYILVEDGKVLSRRVGRLSAKQITDLYFLKVAAAPFKAAAKVTSSVFNFAVPKPSHRRYTWPGGTEQSLRQHLESTHGISTRGLSFQQLRAIHDADHNNGFVPGRN